MTNSNFTEEEARWVAEEVCGLGALPLDVPEFVGKFDTEMVCYYLNSDAAVMPIIRGLERMGITYDVISLLIRPHKYEVRLFNETERVAQRVHPDIAAALRLSVKALIKNNLKQKEN